MSIACGLSGAARRPCLSSEKPGTDDTERLGSRPGDAMLPDEGCSDGDSTGKWRATATAASLMARSRSSRASARAAAASGFAASLASFRFC